jgi:uncharacterized protein YkwD
VASLSVSATRWTGHRIAGVWTAGRHQVEVSYVNDLWVTGGGDRNLRLDRITFHATSTATPSSADATYEARLVQLVNIERVKAGLRPLAVSACADRYAGAWSASMAASDQLVHRSNLGAVMSACGARGIGENIAFGNVTADRMMAMWMGSTGHRANILRASYTHIGVGIARTSTGRVYGTQNFLTS